MKDSCRNFCGGRPRTSFPIFVLLSFLLSWKQVCWKHHGTAWGAFAQSALDVVFAKEICLIGQYHRRFCCQGLAVTFQLHTPAYSTWKGAFKRSNVSQKLLNLVKNIHSLLKSAQKKAKGDSNLDLSLAKLDRFCACYCTFALLRAGWTRWVIVVV